MNTELCAQEKQEGASAQKQFKVIFRYQNHYKVEKTCQQLCPDSLLSPRVMMQYAAELAEQGTITRATINWLLCYQCFKDPTKCFEEKLHPLVECLFPSPLHLDQSIFSCMDRLAISFTFNSLQGNLTTHSNDELHVSRVKRGRRKEIMGKSKFSK